MNLRYSLIALCFFALFFSGCGSDRITIRYEMNKDLGDGRDFVASSETYFLESKDGGKWISPIAGSSLGDYFVSHSIDAADPENLIFEVECTKAEHSDTKRVDLEFGQTHQFEMKSGIRVTVEMPAR